MDTRNAFIMGYLNRGKEMMVFDWDKAARIIKERNPELAEAGLEGDFGCTGDIIYDDGKIIESSYTYLASTWARPILVLNEEIVIPCYVMQSTTDWDEHTMWPDSAKAILNDN